MCVSSSIQPQAALAPAFTRMSMPPSLAAASATHPYLRFLAQVDLVDASEGKAGYLRLRGGYLSGLLADVGGKDLRSLPGEEQRAALSNAVTPRSCCTRQESRTPRPVARLPCSL